MPGVAGVCNMQAVQFQTSCSDRHEMQSVQQLHDKRGLTARVRESR